jgi:hypothetical protein
MWTGGTMAEEPREPPCPLCRRVIEQDSKSPFDRILLTGKRSVIVPALGMFVPGYFLAVSNWHTSSYAAHGLEGLRDIELLISTSLRLMTPHFGDYVIFEHGQRPDAIGSPGSCIDHAHMHMVPGSEELQSTLLSKLDWFELKKYTDLSDYGQDDYTYLRFRNRHYCAVNPHLESQWFRRQVAEMLGIELWDWALYTGKRELEETLKLVALS